MNRQSFQNLEVVVVDNGSTAKTQKVLRRQWHGFQLVALQETRAGKSRALNRGLNVASGELLVFTDDDITATPVWVSSLYGAFMKYPSAGVFCGPIIPAFPPETPEWLCGHPRSDAMFGRFEPDVPEGPLPDNILPFGANFAVRSSDATGMQFRLDLGPSEENGPSLGEDAEFTHRFRQQSKSLIFVPEAKVIHHIEPSQTTLASLLERSFYLGKETVMLGGKLKLIDRQADFAVNWSSPAGAESFERGGLINYYLGQLAQFSQSGNSSFDFELWTALEELDYRAYPNLLSRSAMNSNFIQRERPTIFAQAS